jgi:hypothetical protein
MAKIRKKIFFTGMTIHTSTVVHNFPGGTFDDRSTNVHERSSSISFHIVSLQLERSGHS